MYFEDAAGHRDTITLGFDPSGSDGIDVQFGEVNIIDVPLKSSLDVRITDEWDNRLIHNTPGTYHTKTQIIQKQECGVNFSINSIDIHTSNWPVTASWDSSVFTDPCLNASLFTSIMPYGWWDTEGFLCLLPLNSSLNFTPNDNNFNEYYDYVNSHNDTIHVFWQTFADSSRIVSTNLQKYSADVKINIFPNPTNSKLNFSIVGEDQILSGSLFSIQGKLIKEFELVSSIDVTGFASGIYVLQLNLKSGKIAGTRFLIE